jgi:hypothetical protein
LPAAPLVPVRAELFPVRGCGTGWTGRRGQAQVLLGVVRLLLAWHQGDFPAVPEQAHRPRPSAGELVVWNHPNRALTAHPDGVQAGSESSPEREEFHHDTRDYGTGSGARMRDEVKLGGGHEH